MTRPSERQIALLKKWKLEPPPSKTACKNIIRYVLKGNYTIGRTVGERIAIMRTAQRNWPPGKKVGASGPLRVGVVQYIAAVHPSLNRGVPKTRRGSPYQVFVRWDIGPPSYCTPVTIESIEEEQQPPPS